MKDCGYYENLISSRLVSFTRANCALTIQKIRTMNNPKKINISGTADDFLTPEAIQLIASAEELVPILAERARTADTEGSK